MKRYNFKHMALAIMAVLSFAACSPENYAGVDESALPTMDGTDYQLNVDQSTNQVTMSISQLPQGTYPVWFIDTNTDGEPDFYSTLNQLTKVYGTHGDYFI